MFHNSNFSMLDSDDYADAFVPMSLRLLAMFFFYLCLMIVRMLICNVLCEAGRN